MVLEKKPFVNYTLEDDRSTDSVVLPVRVNLDEQGMIRVGKTLLNINSDSKTLKILARVGLDVLQRTFSDKTLKYLCSEKRERLTDYKVLINQK